MSVLGQVDRKELEKSTARDNAQISTQSTASKYKYSGMNVTSLSLVEVKCKVKFLHLHQHLGSYWDRAVVFPNWESEPMISTSDNQLDMITLLLLNLHEELWHDLT